MFAAARGLILPVAKIPSGSSSPYRSLSPVGGEPNALRRPLGIQKAESETSATFMGRAPFKGEPSAGSPFRLGGSQLR